MNAMLREARRLLERCSQNADFRLASNVHLAFLLDCHFGESERARQLYEESLGEPCTDHNVRVSLLLADLDHRDAKYESALKRLAPSIDQMQQWQRLRSALEAVVVSDWSRKETLLKDAVNAHGSVLRRFTMGQELLRLVAEGQSYTASENLTKNWRYIRSQSLEIRPDLDVLVQGARAAARMGELDLAGDWLSMAYDETNTDEAKRILYLETRAYPDFPR
jgi:hypothetical protein